MLCLYIPAVAAPLDHFCSRWHRWHFLVTLSKVLDCEGGKDWIQYSPLSSLAVFLLMWKQTSLTYLNMYSRHTSSCKRILDHSAKPKVLFSYNSFWHVFFLWFARWLQYGWPYAITFLVFVAILGSSLYR